MSRRVSGRDRDAAFLGDEGRGLADERRVGQPLRRDEDARDGVHLRLVHEIAALRLELALDVFGDRLVDDHRVLRRAEHPVVERLAGDDVADGLLHVGGPFDERGRVAGADAVGRLARAVRRAHEPHAARRQDHRHVAVLHQLLRCPSERHRRHPVDRAGWRASPAGRLVHHLGDARDALDRGRVRAQHDRAAGLDRNQDLVDRRRRGVGRRDDGGDDAERFRDLDDADVVVPRDDADRFHRPDEVVDLLRTAKRFF